MTHAIIGAQLGVIIGLVHWIWELRRELRATREMRDLLFDSLRARRLASLKPEVRN